MKYEKLLSKYKDCEMSKKSEITLFVKEFMNIVEGQKEKIFIVFIKEFVVKKKPYIWTTLVKEYLEVQDTENCLSKAEIVV